MIVLFIIYISAQIVWINVRKATPSFDQEQTYNISIAIASGKEDTLIKNWYLQLYRQQLTLTTLFALIFKIIKIQNPIVLQYLNAIANTLTMLGILLITKQLGKKYEVRKINSILIYLAFLTLPLLSTFVYGDFIGLPMCLFAIYFMMKYSENKKTKYAIISTLFIAIGYIARMNNLIFIIALSIYLLLNILKLEKTNTKKILKGIMVLILFITISMLPATLIKTYWENVLQLEEDEAFPTTGFICMGMQEGERAKGWYNESPRIALQEDVQVAKEYYKNKINSRLKTFASNPLYFIKFYAIKTATMWAENTYGALWYNQSYNFGKVEGTEQEGILDKAVIKANIPLSTFQKAIIIIIFSSTLIALIKNKNNISNEILLLVTIFIGGFLFHTIWEAKSRYIIPYIVVLIPIVSLPIKDYLVEMINNIKKKKIGNGEKNEIIDSNSNLQ